MNEKIENINQYKLSEFLKISERTINICFQSNIKSSKDIIDYYKTNKTFLNLQNCGNASNNELINICHNYFKINLTEKTQDFTNISNISIEQLHKTENLSVRSLNVCGNGQIKTLSELLQYYNKEQTFLRIRNCGDKSNNELIKICKKYIDYYNDYPDNEINKIINPPDELQEIIENLSIKQKVILNATINSQIQNLSPRAYNGLSKHLEGQLSLMNIYRKILSNKNFKFKTIKNIGKKSIIELNKLEEEILENIQLISLFKDDKTLETEYYKAILSRTFGKKELDINETFIDKNNQIHIFRLTNFLITNNILFEEREKQIFIHTFNYTNSFVYKELDKTAIKINLTRERVRQLRLIIYENLDLKLSFLSSFKVDFETAYQIDTNSNIIIIDQKLKDKINKEEDNDFNKVFITKILYSFLFKSHNLIGTEKQFFFPNPQRKKTDWKSTYLIKQTLTNIFNFEQFLNNIIYRINNRITETYKFHFQSYLTNFFKDDNFDTIDIISEICEKILFNELDMVLDLDENIVFNRNILKPTHEYAYEILDTVKKPLYIDEIFELIKQKYPEININKNQVRVSIKKDKGFFAIGKSGRFTLQKHLKDIKSLKKATIRELARKFLTERKEPIHIIDLSELIIKYHPKTNANSIYRNLQIEENNTFMLFHQSFIGLEEKRATDNYQIYLSIPRMFGKTIKPYIREKKSVAYVDAINHFSKEYNLKEIIIKKMVDFQILQKNIKLIDKYLYL